MLKKILFISFILFISLTLNAHIICNITHFTEADGLSQSHVTQIVQDKQGMIWIATWNGLNRYDGYEFKCFKSQPGDGINLPSDRIRNIILNPQGNLWCIFDETILLFDTNSMRFKNITKKEQNRLRCRYRKQNNKKKNKISIYTHTDKYGVKWFITSNGRISYFKKGMNAPLEYANLKEKFNGISKPLTDYQGNLWLRSHDGIYKISFSYCIFRPLKPLMKEAVRCLYLMNNGYYWACSRDGIARLYSPKGYCRYMDKQGLLHSSVTNFGAKIYSMYETKNGTLWIGCKPDGIFRLINNKAENLFKGLQVYDIKQDVYGHLWIATLNNGLKLIPDPNKQHPSIINMKTPLGDKKAPNKIRNILITHDGYIFCTMTTGLLVSKIQKDYFKMHFNLHQRQSNIKESLSSNATMMAIEDHWGRIFICTESGGLNMIERNAKKRNLALKNISFRHFNLSSDVIQSMFETKNKLWVVSENKLITINPETGKSTDYDSNIFGNDLHFQEGKPLIHPSGIWIISTNNGTIIINPTDLKTDKFIPSIAITDIIVENKEKHLQDNTLILNSDERTCTIFFAALDYSIKPKISYAFRLIKKNNNDIQWNYVRDQHSATFTDMEPEEYLLEIRSTNSFGNWMNNIRRIKIIVKPKFAETTLAHILCIISIICILSGILFTIIYIRRIRSKQKETMEAYLALLEQQTEKDKFQQRKYTDIHNNLSEADDAFMKRVMIFIDENLSNADASIDDMAYATATSRSNLNRKMKTITGVTPIEFLAKARMHKALQLINNTSLQVSDIAYQCGYADPKYFSRVFKKTTGMSPSEYKQ